jgi:hypothetical protein
MTMNREPTDLQILLMALAVVTLGYPLLWLAMSLF